MSENNTSSIYSETFTIQSWFAQVQIRKSWPGSVRGSSPSWEIGPNYCHCDGQSVVYAPSILPSPKYDGKSDVGIPSTLGQIFFSMGNFFTWGKFICLGESLLFFGATFFSLVQFFLPRPAFLFRSNSYFLGAVVFVLGQMCCAGANFLVLGQFIFNRSK